MVRLLSAPSLWRPDAAVLHQASFARATRQHPRPRPFNQDRNAAPFAAMSGSVSRSSNPLTAAYRGVAHLFLTSMAASTAIQRRTDEASRPRSANHLPDHPASFVRFVSTVGSPQSCSGARYRRSRISGRFRGRNLVGLDPQSKCFFSVYQECEGLMAAACMTRARITPVRSCRAATGASPMGAKIAVTAPS